MRILANNLKRQYELYAAEYEQKALEVLRSGWYILGNEVERFEREWASFIGVKHCVGLASGLDALWISLRLLGIGRGDEVIVCSNAYIACVMAITMNDAIPVFVEPDEYLNLDAGKIEEAITPHTRAILAVHLYGQTCDMSAVMDIANRHKLRVVEDCAQSHGNRWNGKVAGSFGDAGCFSFYPSKGCGAFGDAGCMVTENDELAEACHVFRNYGSEKRYYNRMIGTNSRLDELQAGLLRVKLSHLNEANEERNRIAARYLQGISHPEIRLPSVRPGADHVWHQFVIRCKQRDALQAWLEEKEIGTLIHYPVPPHLSEAYSFLGKREGAYPVAELLANEVLSLPMYNGMTREETDYVIEAVNAFTV